MGLFLHAWILATIIVPPVTATVPLFIHNIDPTYFMGRYFPFIPSPLIFLGRIIGIWIAMLHAVMILSAGVIIITNIWLSMKLSLNLVQRDLGISKDSSIFRRSSKKHFSIHRQLQIVTTVLNCSLYFTLPIVQIVTFLFAVVMSYVIVKLHDVVPFPLTIIYAAIVVGIGMIYHFVFPLITTITTRSEDLLRLWNLGELSRSGIGTREIRSFGPLRIYVGPFYYIETKARTTLLGSIFYYTASLLITL